MGTGLRSVKQVTGRLTKARAAAGGAFTGAWFGLLIGLLFAIFVIGPFGLGVLLSSVIFGALWGAMFGFVGHWATAGAVTSPVSVAWKPSATRSRSRPATRTRPPGPRASPDHPHRLPLRTPEGSYDDNS